MSVSVLEQRIESFRKALRIFDKLPNRYWDVEEEAIAQILIKRGEARIVGHYSQWIVRVR